MTKRWPVSAAFLWVAASISACIPVERPAERVPIQTEIQFVDATGHPLANETGYLVEPLPFLEEVTQTFMTDQDGKVRLDDTYCAPLSIIIDGGAIVLRRDNASPNHVVTVSPDRRPTKETIYGQPTPGYTTLRRTQSYQDCEQWSQN